MSRKKSNRRTVEGSVYQRGKKWAYTFQGKPHPLTGAKEKVRKSGFETEDEAWDAMAEAKRAMANETFVRPSRATVTDFFEAWFPYVRTTTEPTTAANYERDARLYVLPWIGKRLMQDIVPSVVAALYEQLLTGGRQGRDTNWEMYQLWKAVTDAKREIRPREIADKVGISYAGARRAVRRYEAGRIPRPQPPGLAPKTVKTVHIMLSSAMTTAVAWKYISTSPTAAVKPPTVVRKPHRTWTPEHMTRFLEAARSDGLYGMWVLAASTGMRRSELGGLRTESLDLDSCTVRMTTTRVLAGSAVTTGGGKSTRSRRQLALDRYTVATLKAHLRQLEQERADWGSGYQDHGLVFCWEDGRPIYPDTITEQFNKLVDAAGLPLIKLHDLRHSYATIALRSGVHPKIVSSRLGHATVAFTLDVYSADVPDLDKQAAEDIGGLFLPSSEESAG
jgi:integrase